MVRDVSAASPEGSAVPFSLLSASRRTGRRTGCQWRPGTSHSERASECRGGRGGRVDGVRRAQCRAGCVPRSIEAADNRAGQGAGRA
ncbi:hypothetical protein EYF80_003737 [Liparis tanakae]|uniref:Uncharacterized protein n=1 Tax=Liparis tanakae TaxID=230148 RepID=A0A4Z2J8B7_9TELE|nr:hypothetical protein EYF80_003737 [Liparis tanakae]